jgi:DNA (cytosine-5)-methyltransferase 1
MKFRERCTTNPAWVGSAEPLTVEEAAALQSYPTRRTAMTNANAHIKALDLFAGTGWGVACQRLGIKEAGVEIMPEAVETRTANGMETIYRDVWDGLQLTAEQHREAYGSYGLLIASPPCQTFSLAGKGAGRAALDEVLEAIELHAYKDADALLRFGEQHDMRTALVLTPLAYVWRDRPRLVAMEQVPTVLPVWEACAEVMREWGYEVKVEVLNAEQYGVPQTRKRAILVARRGGPVNMPVPTHSRYYSRTPEKLDPGVLKWVSMAEALGWGDDTQTICHGVQKHSARRPMTEPAATIAFGHDSASVGFVSADIGDHLALRAAKRDGGFEPVSVEQAAILQSYPSMLRSNYGSGGDASKRGERTAGQPAPTPTSKADRNKWDGERNVTVDEAAALQSYKPPFIWCGTKTKQFLQIGNAVPPLLAEHILAALIGIKTTTQEHK